MEDNVVEELMTIEVELEEVQDQIKILLDRQEKLYERQSELKSLLDECKTFGCPSGVGVPLPVENCSGQFEWDSKADEVRFNTFGIPTYRANQREIINAVMSGRDVLVIMAAGGGKSLCYQLPALLHDGVALVVSPLLSLIQDQVMGLTALGIPAYMLTSTTSKDNEKFVYKALEKGEGALKILYVTPEKVSKSKRFMSKLEKCYNAGCLSLISIDEAHCCSQWGHDFRPDYKNLGILKTQFPNVPIIALTATAIKKVQTDLVEMLHIAKCVKFVSTVNRPNLFYMVREKSSVGKVVIDEIADFIQGSYPNNESGIVYCFSRKECEQVAHELRQRGISADYYHADMDVNAREKVHMRWSNNKLQVIVGTSKRECRRSSFFRHFAEPIQDCNGMCDNCAYGRDLKEVDVTCHAKAMISILQEVQESEQRATMLQLMDKVKVKHKELASELKREESEQLIIQLLVDRVLKEEFQHTAYTTNAYVTIGPLWKQVHTGRKTVKLEICSGIKGNTGNKKATKRTVSLSGLEVKLAELRRELSSVHGGIFPHSVLSTQQISMLSSQKPTSNEQLESIIGKLKRDKYGSRILEQIQNYVGQSDGDLPNGVDQSEKRPSKRFKRQNAPVLIESSEDEG
ncbi:hypothetical protein MKX03_003466 [Papaver bracteatum]|nr:hypothetical protein MKX03_003466 [Papaver bracteatum]